MSAAFHVGLDLLLSSWHSVISYSHGQELTHLQKSAYSHFWLSSLYVGSRFTPVSVR